MGAFSNISNAIIRWSSKVLVKSKIIPAADDGRALDKTKPIIYLLKTESGSDMAALEQGTKKLGLPSPFERLSIQGQEFSRCIALEKTAIPFISRRQVRKTDAALTFQRLFRIQNSDPNSDIQIIPVAVFWGRSPNQTERHKQKLFWGAVTSPSWLSKLFVVLFSGRNTFVVMSPFVSSFSMSQEKSSDEHLAHRLLRVARVHFRRKENAVLGPTQFNREQLYLRLIKSPAVTQAIADEVNNSGQPVEKVKANAAKYFEEIAADFRPRLLTVFDKVLTLLWNKIYSGIEVRNFDEVRKTAQKGHEIVYVPCHRSHIDYLLLTYVIYHQGLMTPHIAAGVNLNFWPAGPIFRRAGAFFIRRTFKGNRLYTVIFREYLDQLFNLGYPVKFFCEGGRSRTGRLLQPKTGMLAMTLQSVLRGVERPVSLVPVYIGYEHVMEVASYLKELSGNEKKKESVGQIFGAIRRLRNFGLGYVSFGKPISVNQYLSEQYPAWNEEEIDSDNRPKWLTPVINNLAQKIQIGINQATAANPIMLVSMSLLASEKRALSRDELIRQLTLYSGLLRNVNYNSHVYLSNDSAEQMLDKAIAHNKFEVVDDSLGDIIRLDAKTAIAMTYYRNNVKHLFIIPALVAALIAKEQSISRNEIVDFVSLLYPVLQHEWFIEVENLGDYIEQIIAEFLAVGLVTESNGELKSAEVESSQFFALALLARTIQDSLQRYAVVLSIIENSKKISRSDLERQSQSLAQRLSSLHGINAPEFFDKKVLAAKVSAFKENELVDIDDDGFISHSQISHGMLHKVLELLDFEVRQTILNN